MSQSGTGGPLAAIVGAPAEALSAMGNMANTAARVPGQIAGAAMQPLMHNAFAANNPVIGAGGQASVSPTTPASGSNPSAASGLDQKTLDILSALGGSGAGGGARSAAEAMQAAQRGVPTVAYGRGQDAGQQITQLLQLINEVRGGASG